MIWVDYVIIAIIALSALVGLARGLVREVISLVVWVAALAAAWLFYEPVALQLTPWISTPSLRIGVAVLILVFAVLIAGAIFGYLLATLVDKTGLTGTDRLLGVVFGGARGVVLVALMVFLASLTPLTADPWWEQSQLLDQFKILADWMLEQVPPDVTERIKAF
ncbi:MAG: CvpA family protein [Lamprobacter sp.]|uniref:CvpA family protein n=1 Tax=Lamprobacter sp. TaxID=3100796 RepID=UPI002B25B1F6|nr:CvpA family protein [Lamprobacter sp.]MEA3639433.1 CvpA family protein [Lamprobacter sp.]